MKRQKKLFSLVLAVMMATMVMAFPIIASADDNPGSITIAQPKSTAVSNAGQTFNVYRVFDTTVDTGYTSYSYKVNANFAGFFSEPAGTAISSSAFDDIIESKGGIDGFAEALMDYVDIHHIPADGTGSGTADTLTVIGDLPLGYYLVTGSVRSNDANATTITAACSLTTTNPTVTIYPKADVPTITKEVWNHNTSGWEDWTDVNIGADVDFKLTSMVPENLVGYEHYLYAVHDKMSAGLTFDAASVAVKIGGSNVDAGNYTVIYPATDGDAFDIVFKSDYFVGLINGTAKGDEILVTYSATLNSGAVIGYNGNPNEVQLEYSNNPYDTGDGTPAGSSGKTNRTPWHKVVVYTYELNVFKYAGALTLANGLADAGFELRAYAAGAATTFTGSDGEYTKDPVGTVTTLTSPTSGKINLKGLDAGTYYLVETVVPEGYNGLDSAVTIVITHNNPNTVTGNFTVGQYQTVEGEYEALAVLNQSGTMFPGTGGIGRAIFMVVGGLLMAGALVTVFVKRRVKA